MIVVGVVVFVLFGGLGCVLLVCALVFVCLFVC